MSVVEPNGLPLISILVPTIGRRTLVRTLASIHQQLPRHEKLTLEVIVVGDTADGPLPFAELVVRHYEEHMPIRYLPVDAGRHCWGHPNKNVAQAEARGMWICTMDDDDIYTKGAFIQIYDAMLTQPTPRPLIFRMIDPNGARLPSDPPMLIQGNVGAPCIVTPHVPGLLGTWGDRYEGDFDFIKSTMDLWGGEPDWRDDVIAICRPSAGTDWTGTT